MPLCDSNDSSVYLRPWWSGIYTRYDLVSDFLPWMKKRTHKSLNWITRLLPRRRSRLSSCSENVSSRIALPSFLAHCLNELNLSDNCLDCVPPSVCQLVSLQTLDISKYSPHIYIFFLYGLTLLYFLIFYSKCNKFSLGSPFCKLHTGNLTRKKMQVNSINKIKASFDNFKLFSLYK